MGGDPLAESINISAAVAAFLVGISLSGEAATRAHSMLSPLRAMFAAVFFVFFGLSTDPRQTPRVWSRPWSWVWSRWAPRCSGAGGRPDAMASDRRNGFVTGWRSSLVASAQAATASAATAPGEAVAGSIVIAGLAARAADPHRRGAPAWLEPVSVSIWSGISVPNRHRTRGLCAPYW